MGHLISALYVRVILVRVHVCMGQPCILASVSVDSRYIEVSRYFCERSPPILCGIAIIEYLVDTLWYCDNQSF